jgi:hypothetical protein|tara:strand:+ start:484 stop:723 length:240 start_codon:yes stop_codon:yes gene_type:complete
LAFNFFAPNPNPPPPLPTFFAPNPTFFVVDDTITFGFDVCTGVIFLYIGCDAAKGLEAFDGASSFSSVVASFFFGDFGK